MVSKPMQFSRLLSGVSVYTQRTAHSRRLTPCCCGGAMPLRPGTAELFTSKLVFGGEESKTSLNPDLMHRGRPGMGAAQASGAQQQFRTEPEDLGMQECWRAGPKAKRRRKMQEPRGERLRNWWHQLFGGCFHNDEAFCDTCSRFQVSLFG